MRRLLIPIPFLLAALLLFGWANDRPPVPEFTPLADPVDLAFEVNGVDGRALELGLLRGPRGRLFLQFDVGMEDGRPVVTLNGAGGRSTVKGLGRDARLPDWSFLKDRSGKPVMTHPFANQLVELPGGQPAVRMVYTGANVPLLHALKVARPVTLPPFLGKALGHDGPVQLQPGTYPVDEDAGVTIPANLLGS